MPLPFLNNLAEKGIKDNVRYQSADQLKVQYNRQKWTMQKLSQASGVSMGTVKNALSGHSVLYQSALRISDTMGKDIDALFTQIGEPEPLAKTSIKTYQATISTILSSAVPDIIPFNPALHMKLKRKKDNQKSEVEIKKEKKKFIDNIDTARMIVRTLCRDLTHENMCLILALMSGLRKGELAALRWEHIDFNDRVIYVINSRGNVKNVGIVEKGTKTKSSERIVCIDHWTLHLLAEYKERCREMLRKNGKNLSDGDYLFIRRDGEPYYPDTLYKWMKQLLERFGYPDLHPHSMRHTFASFNADILTRRNRMVSDQLGHSSDVTERVYIHSLDMTKSQMAEEFGKLIFGDDAEQEEDKPV